MCLALRNTLRRGCSEVPLIFLRMRSFLRSRPTICIAIVVVSLPALPVLVYEHEDSRIKSLLAAGLRGLASLLADLLALVANALATVGLRRTKATDLGGGL